MKARQADLHNGWIASVARSCASVTQSAHSQSPLYAAPYLHKAGLSYIPVKAEITRCGIVLFFPAYPCSYSG